MVGQNRKRAAANALRRRAEQMELQLRQVAGDEQIPSGSDVAELVHELNVHQIELEIQNEEMREAQLALAEMRDRYVDLYEFAPVGYLTLDPSGGILSANLTAASLLNSERNALIGRPLSAWVHAGSQDALHLHRIATLANSQVQTVDLRLKSDGPELYVRIESLATGGDGKDIGFNSTLTDITELVRARHALEAANATLEHLVLTRTQELGESNAKLVHEARLKEASAKELARTAEFGRTLIETARTIILVLDSQARIVYFNPYMEALCGYSLAEVRGRDWFETFIPARDRHWLQRLFHSADNGVRARGNVNAIITKGGEERLIEWYDAEVNLRRNPSPGVLCTGQDVTERRTLEKQLLHIAEQEQRRIGQQLHDDLGQELAAMKVITEIMSEGLDEEGSAETVHAARLLDGLTRSLRKLRDLSHGLINLTVTAATFAEELHALCEQFEIVECHCDCDPELAVNDDQTANQLYYIAREAMTNSVKHGGSDKLRVEIVLASDDSGTILTISDSGPGLPKDRSHSTGSGLHIMEYRARLIGANLQIDNRPEGGTLVRCTLPGRR